VGDDPSAVRVNHERICQVLDIERDEVVSSHQVHGAVVQVVGERDRGRVCPETDALITASPDVYLMLRFADCVPVFVYDPVQRVAGLAHAGWRGTVAGIAAATVQKMTKVFDCRPADIVGGIGASIGPCCYEVGIEVLDALRQSYPGAPHLVQGQGNGCWYADLWEANRYSLAQAGLAQIEIAEQCTACHTDEWFSHRAEKGRTGRLGAVIGMRR
jgi:YfiH family protein